MAYHELIKNFNRIRSYLRSFYVYGFKHRADFDQKSSRSYDNERRRVESWLQDYISFGQDADGRRVFLSVDSRAIPENPLYRAFRTKSFTDRDITLHFFLLDILQEKSGLSIASIMDKLADRLSAFQSDDLPDESTVRKKLKEYVELGIVKIEQSGRETHYSIRNEAPDLSTWREAASFFSEAAPLGIIGSFLISCFPMRFSSFRFKHHYILNALDSEVLYELLLAVEEKKTVTITVNKQKVTVIPRKIYVGTQSGRQYLLAWAPAYQKFLFYRLDLIDKIHSLQSPVLEDLSQKEKAFTSHVWGVSANNQMKMDHLEMTVFVSEEEEFIIQRLKREKRCGEAVQIDESHWSFSADVLDALEMLPWLRTFTGRITALNCSNPLVIERFQHDFEAMTEMYGGGNNALS